MTTKQISAEARTKAEQLGKALDLKLRLLIEGVQFEDSALAEVGTVYQEANRHLFDLAHKTTPRKTPDYMELPVGTTVMLREDANSPYVFSKEDGQFVIKSGGKILMEASLLPRPGHWSKRTSDGTEMWRIAFSRREAGMDRLGLTWSSSCAYGKDDCHFCTANWAQQEYRDERVLPAKRLRALKEVVTEALSEGNYVDFAMTGGRIVPEERELEQIVAIIRVVKEALGMERIPIGVCHTAPRKRQIIEALYNEGVKSLAYNLEVWNPDYFRAICPGKAKDPGREGWIQALKWVVEIFGRGKVGSSCLITGIEPMEYNLEGVEYLLSMGVRPECLVWSPAGLSKFRGHRSPTVDWYLEQTEKAADLFFKYGMVSSECADRRTLIGVVGDELNRRMLLQDADWQVPPVKQPLKPVSRN